MVKFSKQRKIKIFKSVRFLQLNFHDSVLISNFRCARSDT